jgi:Ni,Fe-hydrogenase III large subunit
MNKNTKARFNSALKLFRKQGQTMVTVGSQTFNFAQKSAGTQVISQNKARNMQMVVYKNQGTGNSGNNSMTKHEAISKDYPASPVKKKYTDKDGRFI